MFFGNLTYFIRSVSQLERSFIKVLVCHICMQWMYRDVSLFMCECVTGISYYDDVELYSPILLDMGYIILYNHVTSISWNIPLTFKCFKSESVQNISMLQVYGHSKYMTHDSYCSILASPWIAFIDIGVSWHVIYGAVVYVLHMFYAITFTSTYINPNTIRSA